MSRMLSLSCVVLSLFGGPGRFAAAQDPAPVADEVARIWGSAEFQRRFADSLSAESDIEPAVPKAERDVLQQAVELIGQGKDNEVVALLQPRVGPGSSAVLDFTLGSLHFKNERFDEAVPLYRAAVQKKARFRRAWKNLGLIHVRQGDFRAAAIELVRVIELGGGDAITFGLLGFAHANNDDQIAAESAYRMAALMDPATVDWRLGLARTFFKQRRFAEAAELCAALIGQHPERHDLWLLQANAFVGMGETRRAAENLELVDGMGRATAESLAMLGDIYVNDEQFELAADAWQRAVALDKKGTAERAMRAAKALAARNANEPSQKLIASIEVAYAGRLDPAVQKELLKLRARLALNTGKDDEQAKVLEQVVSMDPLDGDALILLGQHYARSGKPEQAVFRFERAANIPAFEADAKYRHAQLLVGQGKYGEALPLLKRAQQVKPREALQPFVDQVENLAKGK